MTDNATLLLGRVGSHAYGLSHEESDEDFLGVFAAPTLEVAGLNWSSHRESIVQSSPGNFENDTALHEIGKYLKLTLKSNPTVTELLWLQPDEYSVRTDLGDELISIRHSLLSEKYVSAAYRGYASQQLQKFASSGEWKPKHARHCLRLIRQGLSVLETGELEVRVPDPQVYWDLNDMRPDQVVELLHDELDKFDSLSCSALPHVPDESAARALLAAVRRRYL